MFKTGRPVPAVARFSANRISQNIALLITSIVQFVLSFYCHEIHVVILLLCARWSWPTKTVCKHGFLRSNCESDFHFTLGSQRSEFSPAAPIAESVELLLVYTGTHEISALAPVSQSSNLKLSLNRSGKASNV